MPNSGRESASATYRGFRNQALYVLARLLTDDDAEHRVYRPEGSEDLAIFDSTQHLVEAVQVKDYASDLALSHFKPASPNGFFARFKQRQIAHPKCVTRLASFGPLGPELHGAIKGDDSKRKSVVKKIHAANSDIKVAEAEAMLDTLQKQVERPVAANLHSKVLGALEGTIAGGHAPSTMELLMYWVFNASENQRDLTRTGLLRQIELIGDYLAALRDTSHEWGVSVRPVTAKELMTEDVDRLKHEYRLGVQAQWEHILADADCPRPERLNEIHRQLQRHSTVIVRGASGQGKSSLGWRYLSDFCADGLRFHIRLVEGREHAFRVANALRAHVQRLRLQAVVYIDLSPSDVGWAELVRELALTGLKVLVTVREEDFQRAGLAIGDFDYGEIILEGLTRAEAGPIYASLYAEGGSTTLDFEEAWARFSVANEGPLLEFTHLVTEGESLASRIRSQVLRLQREAATGKNGVTAAHLDLLALAAIANSSDARVDLHQLCEAVGLQLITRPLAVLENEYFLRMHVTNGDNECSTVSGLHVLRSCAVLDALLADCPEQWCIYATRCLPLVVDEDVENYLLYAFSRHPEHSELLESKLHEVTPRSWTHAGGIARALIWEGVSRYEQANRETILGAIAQHNSGWQFFCDSFIGLGDNIHKDIFASFSKIHGGNIQQIKLTPKSTVFTPFEEWADSIPSPPAPSNPLDWVRAGDVAYWIGHCQVDGALRSTLEALLPATLPADMTIQEIAEFVSGRERLGDEGFLGWHDQQHAELVSRFVRDSDSIHVTDDGCEVKVFFAIPLVDSAASGDSEANDWNTQAMRRVRLIRKLFPHRELFGSQGIGLEALAGLLPNDPSFKQIPAKNLPVERAVQLNAIFGGLVSYRHQRPETWNSYAGAVVEFRETVSDCFRKLHRGWGRLLGEATPQARTVKNLPTEELKRVNALSKHPMFPRTAVDEWGFVSEGRDQSLGQGESNAKCEAALRRFEGWRKAHQDFEFSVKQVSRRIIGQTVSYLDERRGHPSNDTDEKEARLLLVNLATAWEAVHSLQREFGRRFGEICSPGKLATLEKYEHINFRHLWAVTFALCYERQGNLPNASHVIEAETARRRRLFLDALNTEISSVLDHAGSVTVRNEPWVIDEIPHLCIICDHRDIGTIEDTAPRIVEAIWRAAQTGGWRPLEWQPFVIEWPKIAIVHLVRGRALQSAFATFFTKVVFVTETEFEVKPHHYIALPVATDFFTESGFALWDSPLLRATLALHEWVTAFGLTNMRFYPLAELIIEKSIEEDSANLMLERFFQELTTVLNAAQESYSQLDLLLDTINTSESEQWMTELHRLCTIRLMSVDSHADVAIDIDNFTVWLEQVEATATEYDVLMTALMSFSIRNQA